jgi:hypothetical protein
LRGYRVGVGSLGGQKLTEFRTCFAFSAFRRAAQRARCEAAILARAEALPPFCAELFRFTAERAY